MSEGAERSSSVVPSRTLLIASGAAFVLIVGALVWISIQRGSEAVSAPGPNTVGEAGKVYFAQRAQQGRGLFLAGDQRPFYPSFHGALLHGIVGVVGKLGGASTIGLFYIGRSLSVAATLGVLVLVGLILRRWNMRWWWTVPLVLVFLAPYRVIQHAFSYRPDHWIMFLSVASCYLLIVRPDRRSTLIMLGMVPVVAFFIKPTGAVLLPIVAAGWLVQGRLRDAAICSGLAAALGLISVVSVDASSNGAFLDAMSNAAGVGYSWSLVLDCLSVPIIWLPLFLPVFLAARIVSGESLASQDRRIMLVFWAGTLLTALLTSSRLGSNSYYFIEPFLFGLVLLTARLAEDCRARGGVAFDRATRHVAVIGLVVSFQGVPPLLSHIDYTREHGTLPRDIALSETLELHRDRQVILARLGEMITDSAATENWACLSDDPGLNVLLDEPVMVQPLVTSMMMDQGTLDASVLVDPIREGRIALIVLSPYRWSYRGIERLPPKVFRAIQRHYIRAQFDSKYSVFVPRGGRRASAEMAEQRRTHLDP